MRAHALLPRTYGVVLTLVGITYLVSSTTGADRQPAGVLLQVATVWFALTTAQVPRVMRAVLIWVMFAIAVAAIVGTFASAAWVILAASAPMYVVAPVAIVRHLALRPVVDHGTLLGAVASYVMIGMLYAFTYQFIAAVQSAPFFDGRLTDPTTSQTLFFSFTTLTTTGYGNFVPAGNPGQSLAVSEMLIGQLFLVIVIAKVVTALKPLRPPARPDRKATDVPPNASDPTRSE